MYSVSTLYIFAMVLVNSSSLFTNSLSLFSLTPMTTYLSSDAVQ